MMITAIRHPGLGIKHAVLGLIILLTVPSNASTGEGWYLLLPPERDEWSAYYKGQPVGKLLRVWVDDKAPLTEWVHYRAFDRAVDCERARTEEKAEGDRVIGQLKYEDTKSQLLRFLDRLAMSRCVSAVDPRLVPKRPPE